MINFFLIVIVFWYQFLRISKLRDEVSVLRQHVKKLNATIASYSPGAVVHTQEKSPQISITQDIPKVSSVITQVSETVPVSNRLHATPQQKKVQEADPRQSFKLLAQFGIAAVIIGIGFFFKYAVDNDWISELMRVALGYGAGFLAIVVGRVLKDKGVYVSNILQGGGIAIWYISLIFSVSLYNLISFPIALALMVLISAVGYMLSLNASTHIIALVSLIGAFITPHIIDSFSESYTLFILPYTLIISIGGLFLSRYKGWNSILYASCFGVFITLFQFFSYQEPLGLSFAIYFIVFALLNAVAIIVSILLRQLGSGKESAHHAVLVGITLLWLSSLLNLILFIFEYSSFAGLSSLILACCMALMAILYHTNIAWARLMKGAYASYGILFLLFATILEFEPFTYGLLWVFIGVSVIISGIFARNILPQYAGGVIMLSGLAISWFDFIDQTPYSDIYAFTNLGFAVFCVGIVATMVIRYAYGQALVQGLVLKANEITLSNVSTVLIHAFIVFSVTREIMNPLLWSTFNLGSDENVIGLVVSFWFGMYAIGLTLASIALESKLLRQLSLGLFLITAFQLFISLWTYGALYRIFSFIGFGVLALLASYFYIRHDRQNK